MSGDCLTVLRTTDNARLTKIITPRPGGIGFNVQQYDRAWLFGVNEIGIGDVIELGRALETVSRDPCACVIRGQPLPHINRRRCRRLVLPRIDDAGTIQQPSFEAAARAWIAIDFDNLPMPEWDPEDLAVRRAAIARDELEQPIDQLSPKGPDDGEGYDFEADGDPAPINANDWAILIRAAINQLPAEFGPAHCWFQFTASHGIKPGINCRLWFWCDRPVTDAEAKRWLATSPIDRALFSPVQVHYLAPPIFTPADLDPIRRRTGFWWRHVAEVAVPELPEPPPPPPVEREPLRTGDHRLAARATAYATTVLKGIETAGAKQHHPTMRKGAITLFALAEHGLLDPGEITRELLAIGRGMSWPEHRLIDLLDWSRAKAASNPALPRAFL